MPTSLVNEIPHRVIREVALTTERSRHLQRMAQAQLASEDEVIERALDLYFQLTDFFDFKTERQDWHGISEASLGRVWENDQDAVYDNWKDLYDISKG